MAAMVTSMTMSGQGKVQRWVAEYVHDPGEDCTRWPWARFRDGRAAMSDPARGNTVAAARVVWSMAAGEQFPEGKEVRHLCGNGHLGCVNPRHLRPGTRSENINDRFEHGQGNRGQRHYRARLTDQQVVDICTRVASGERQVDVADSYGISKMLVSKLWLGQRWKHVSAPRKAG